MTLVSMQYMPLASAYLCEDCHCVGNCAEQCPACASESLMGLAGVLNRGKSKEKTESASRGKLKVFSHRERGRMMDDEVAFPAAWERNVGEVEAAQSWESRQIERAAS
jgi:hypothetical protein